MLQIRKEQMDALSLVAIQNFEDQMVAHLYEFFPEHCEALEEEEIREAIRFGIEKAESYDITDGRDVAAYIDLMFALGPEFDADPALPWAHRTLTDKSMPDSEERMETLYEAADKHLAVVERRSARGS